MDLFKAVLEQGSIFTIAFFSTIAWSLWQRWNRHREQQPTWPLHEIGSRAKELVVEFFDIHKQVPSQVARFPRVRWSPPPVGVYKANFDAALFGHYNSARLGVVFRVCTRHMIGALSQKIPLPQSVEHAEALAVSQVVSLAMELCLFQVIFEGDCQRIIIAINSTEACHALFGHIIEEIRCHSSSLVSSCFKHTCRDTTKNTLLSRVFKKRG